MLPHVRLHGGRHLEREGRSSDYGKRIEQWDQSYEPVGRMVRPGSDGVVHLQDQVGMTQPQHFLAPIQLGENIVDVAEGGILNRGENFTEGLTVRKVVQRNVQVPCSATDLRLLVHGTTISATRVALPMECRAGRTLIRTGRCHPIVAVEEPEELRAEVSG